MRQWIVAAAMALALGPISADAAPPTAEQMANHVAQTLRDSGQLRNYRVGVKFNNGVAWLMGEVTSDEQAAIATQLARQVPGVSKVINKLDVVSDEPVAAPAPTKPALEGGSDLLLAMLEKGESTPAPVPASAEAPAEPNPIQPRGQVQGGRRGMPRPFQRTNVQQAMGPQGRPMAQQAQYGAAHAGGMTPQGYSTAGAQGVSYNGASMPGYAWPSYAAYPNYSAVTYPQQYSPAAWPYIGPFYPYPQVPLGWRKVTLEWDDGWWYLDFSHRESH